MSADAKLLASLKPTQQSFVMDLVNEAGIDVTCWSTRSNGEPVDSPRANPAYCFNWSFGSETEGFLVCIWHGSMELLDFPSDKEIGYRDNLRESAIALDRIAIDRTQPQDDRTRARQQAYRARATDHALQFSFRRDKAVRVMVLDGAKKHVGVVGKESAVVDKRNLDPERWFVHSYDNETGSAVLMRGVMPPGGLPPDSKKPTYVDQFSGPSEVLTRDITVSVRARSAAVRQAVLNRAAGECELCHEAGFVTTAGSIYLETHHVVPLAENGPDHPSNVVAICPKDHRRAHYAENRDEIANKLIEYLNQQPHHG